MKTYLRNSTFTTLAGLCLLATACGGSDGTSTAAGGGSAAVTGTVTAGAMDSVAELPASTDPVVDETASGNLAKGVGVGEVALTGVNLSTASDADFNTNSSMAMCEMVNRAKNTLREASLSDRIECYMAQIIAANEAALGDYDDNSYHVVAFSGNGGDEGMPSKIKVKVHKDSAGNIDNFEMFICDASTQSEYIHKTISDGTFAMAGKGVGTWAGDGFSIAYGHTVAVGGTLNESGQFTGEKSIGMTFTNTGTQSELGTVTSRGVSSVTQTADNMLYNGYEYFEQASQSISGAGTVQIYALAQLIDGNDTDDTTPYNPALLAFGNGAARMHFEADMSGYPAFEEDYSESWDGDTTEAVASNDLTSSVSSATVPDAGAAFTIGFSGDEVYDCSLDDVEVTITMTESLMSTMQSSCNVMDASEWIGCYTVIAMDDQLGEGQGGGSSCTLTACQSAVSAATSNSDMVNATSCNSTSGQCEIACSSIADSTTASQCVTSMSGSGGTCSNGTCSFSAGSN